MEPNAAGASGAPSLTIGLRNGATVELRDGALTIGGATVPLANLRAAYLVSDSSVAVAPGQPPAPAVALALTDGSSYSLTPTEQADAARLLQAIQAARPDLAAPQQTNAAAQPGPTATGYPIGPYAPPVRPAYPAYPPQPGAYTAGPGYPPPYAAPAYPGYPGYSPQAAQPRAPDGDRGLAVLSHLSGFFLPVILPLILWLALRTSHPYSSKQAKQAFFWQLILFGVGYITAGVAYATFFVSFFNSLSSISTNPSAPPTTFPFSAGSIVALVVMYGALLVVSVGNLVGSIIAAMQAAEGKPFHYPLLGRL